MWLRNDVLMADVNGRKKPFRKLQQPPVAPEDELIGTWEGPGGRLTLTPSLDYYWEDTSSEATGPVSIRCQGGQFTYENRQLRMMPDSPRQDPVIVSTTRDHENRITSFQSSGGTMERLPSSIHQQPPDRGTTIESTPKAENPRADKPPAKP